jgi:hypothetical protein
MICKKCKRRYGNIGIDFWSIKLGQCKYCKDEIN